MTGAITLSFPDHGYLRQLRVLGAWWCLGSSLVDPVLLLRYLGGHPVAALSPGG
jgi:hypothetical protein